MSLLNFSPLNFHSREGILTTPIMVPIIRMGIVMGTLVSSDVIIASYQTCISDIKGQSVGFF